MRTLIKLDLKIQKDEALALLDDYADFIKEHTSIECEFYVERKDFSQVPTSPDSDGDLKPTRAYMKALEKEVHDRYRDYGTDNIIMWVHEDNFLFRGIWGSNFSYFYHKYSTQLCRWDKDNSANTFGTLYHEQMHSFDRLVLEELKIDVNKLFGYDWDAGAVHGAGKWDYIGRRTGRENTEALKQIAPYVLSALKKRKEKHDKEVGLLHKLIKVLSTYIPLLARLR